MATRFWGELQLHNRSPTKTLPALQSQTHRPMHPTHSISINTSHKPIYNPDGMVTSSSVNVKRLQGYHNFEKLIHRSQVLTLQSQVQLVFHSIPVRPPIKLYFVRWFQKCITLGLRSSTSGKRNNTLWQTVVVLIIFPSDNFLSCYHQVRAELQKSSSEESSPLQKQYSPTLNFIERKTFRYHGDGVAVHICRRTDRAHCRPHWRAQFESNHIRSSAVLRARAVAARSFAFEFSCHASWSCFRHLKKNLYGEKWRFP